MDRRTSTIAVAGILVLGLLPSTWSAPASAAPSVTRYASPNGSGSSCTQNSPCDLLTAVNNAPTGAEVVIKSGHYGSQISPIPDDILGGAQNLDIHGLANKPMPVIFSSATTGLEVLESTVEHLSIVHTGASGGLSLRDSTADHVRVQSTEVACYMSQGRLYNSVCESTGDEHAVYTFAKYMSLSSTLRNVTAVSSGSGTTAVECDASVGGSCSIGLINVIAMATGGGFDVGIHTYNGGSAVIGAFNSDFFSSTENVEAGSTGAINTDASDIDGTPTFVDQANGDFREAASSPTIDAGLTGGAEGSIDLAGLPRVLGKSADIGAYEFVAHPAVSHVKVAKRGKHSLHLTASVDTRGVPAFVQVIAHHHHTSVAGDPAAIPAHAKATTIKVVAGQLRAHNKYKVEVKVTSAGGTSSASKRARTR